MERRTCNVILFSDITSEASFRALEALSSPSAKIILARASLTASASLAKDRSKLGGKIMSILKSNVIIAIHKGYCNEWEIN